MPPKLFPDFQAFLDTRDNKVTSVTRVTMVSGDDHMILPRAIAGTVNVTSDAAANLNFYLNPNLNRVQIDADRGDVLIVTARHNNSYADLGDETE